MPKVPITFACGLYDRMLALLTGDVQADGIELNFIPIDNPREMFDRMVLAKEFDASEMSSADYLRSVGNGNRDFIALPVFPSRVFRHGHIAVNRKMISSPKDLAGKRIGVPLYGMTAAVFQRGMLQHDHGVDLSGVTWVEGGLNDTKPHGAPNANAPIKPIRIENSHGKSLNDLLVAGDIVATIGSGLPKACGLNPDIQRLFPDYHSAEKDYYKRTKIFPIMHLVVLRRDVYEQHPFVATSLYRALCDAKDWALRKMRYEGTLRYMLPWLAVHLDEIKEVFGGDPWPYGVEENRQTLEALVQYEVDQGLIAKPIPIEDLFAPTYGLRPEPA